ncbi:MAG TPA: PA14 domain-containing protein [Puia sp.]|nr:PA14 domain-containing protein [Puia sp.]
MKTSASIIFLVAAFISVTGPQDATAQRAMNPDDSVYTYNAAAAPGTATNPNQPASGKIGKWVRTVRLSWNTNEYKAYIYNGSAFRIHFPKSYNPTAIDGKRYPILIFYCGDGEEAGIYDNEDQLAHGGQPFMWAIDGGKFDGYAIFMQTRYGWGEAQWLNYQALIDSLVVGYKGDPYRVIQNGLSGGGQGIWNHLAFNPTYFAASVPMSATLTSDGSWSFIHSVRFMPIWNLDGALDNDPTPSLAFAIQDSMLKYGANYTLYEFPTEGHDTWDSTWLKPGWWPYCNNSYQSNPWPLYGRTNFCPGQTIHATLGVVGGLQGYQWRKNGVNIAGANSDTLLVTAPGTYDVQVKRGNYYWSDFSHTPVVITVQSATQAPPVTTLNGASAVLPDAAGDTSVTLTMPPGDSIYTWKYLRTGAIVGRSQSLTVGESAAGDYAALIIPPQGCSGIYSPAFPVVKASGPNAPPPATNLEAAGQSFTSVRLTWVAIPNPVHKQTAFEIYRGSRSGTYKFLRAVNPDSLGYTDIALQPGTKYFYVVRAVDTSGAAALSNEASATTLGDFTPPTAPGNLTVVSTTSSSIALSWTASTDNVGVDHYAVYENGVLANVTHNLNFLVNALTAGSLYSFYVKAVDGSGNYSNESNQVDAPAVNTGLNYSYYTTRTPWSVLPAFSALTPVKTGQMSNVSIVNASQPFNFSYVWSGYITIPVTGTYTFATTSDDGSALWFGQLKPGSTSTATVNNDGSHAATTVSSKAISLTAGQYPICVAYFQAAGGASMTVSWSSAQAFGNTTLRPIASQYFAGGSSSGGAAPAKPTQVTAVASSYDRVNLTWKDNSNNETGFGIYRATAPTGPWTMVHMSAAGSTSYSDAEGLLPNTRYYYKVAAVNQYGNSGYDSASMGGISYNFYKGSFNPLYNFDSAHTPVVSSGVLNNISLSPAGSVTTYFGFLFAGTIRIPKSGTWTFYTRSDDASELFVNGYKWANVVVNNNYQQAMTQRSGTITLAAGTYPLYVSYEQSAGGEGLTVSWSNTGAGIAQSAIPDSAFGSAGWTTKTFAMPVALTKPDKVPVLNPIADIHLNFNQSATVTVTTTADSTNAVTLTAANLPPFATFKDNGNGTGTISVRPSAGTVGSFLNITLSSADQNDSVSTATFGIYVIDPNVTSTYIHFSDGIQLGQFPWNNFTSWPGAGYSLQKLVNDQSQSTEMSIAFTNGMAGNFAGGMQPRNGAGIYPDAVMRSGEFENTSRVDTILVSGLTNSKTYNFVFFNSIDYGGKGVTNYTINGTTVSLDPKYNLSNTARINHIMPNAAGQVRIAVSKANSNQSYAFINDLVVESYVDTPAKILSPVGLTVSDMSRNSVSLQWQVRSYNQTAIEVWRGTDSGGSAYRLIATLPSAATAFTDATVRSNVNYFYLVRAVNANAASNFCNPVEATPYAYEVYMNFSVLSAGLPWNNLLYVPNQGFVWPDNFFSDDIGAVTNTGLIETGLWAGEANFGMNTGNNSGVVPDAVMQDAYAVFPGQTGSVRITGLDMDLTYDLTVFGSSQFSEDQNALYTANGKSCLLNALNNETGELTIYGVTPDATGSINLSATCGTPTSRYAILNSVVIKGHNPYMPGATPARPAGTAMAGGNAVQGTAPVLAGTADSTLSGKDPIIYPNPVKSYFTLCVPATAPGKVQVSIFDINGQLIYRREFGGLVSGNNFFEILTPPGMIPRGVYFVSVLYVDNKTVKAFKILKD